MKGTSSWVLAVLAVLSSSAAQNCPFPDPMTHVVFLPHPSDCTKYYMCSNGNAIPQDCSPGLHFSPDTNVCDWPQSANCQPASNQQLCEVEFVPHPTDCTKYYTCSNGDLIERDCPPGLHFNPKLNVCDWQQDANCVVGCEKLDGEQNGVWSPSSCSSDANDLGSVCSLRCQNGYVLRGSAYTTCTEDGWQSSNGAQIPKCVPTECIGEDLENELNKTLSVNASLLFVLDESGSVGTVNFQKTKEFVKHVIAAFPLSETRSSGVITFASNSLVPIPLAVSNTDDFFRRVDAIPYRTGGTDILSALHTALSVISSQSIHPLTLVFLITDGESQTDGTPAADKIKAAEYPLFTIGIGSTMLVHLEELSSSGANGIKHFFHFRDYDVLESIGEYLNPSNGKPGSGGGVQCS